MEELWLRLWPLFPCQGYHQGRARSPRTAAGTPLCSSCPISSFLQSEHLSKIQVLCTPPPLTGSPTHLACSCLGAFARLFPGPRPAAPRCLYDQPFSCLCSHVAFLPPPCHPTKNCISAWYPPFPLLYPPKGSVVLLCFLLKHFSLSHVFCHLLIFCD